MSMEGERHLPTAIIQHIQSFMEDESATQTSLLSKSWYRAWSTRPVLVLQNYGIRTKFKTGSEIFCNFARKTILRYIVQNISVDKLEIKVDMDNSDLIHLDRIILDASNLRMNELYLNEDYHSSGYYKIPPQLFGQRYLRKVDLFGCEFYQLAKYVPWPRLLSLSLRCTRISEDTLWQILSRCRLIEYLHLYSLCSTTTYNVSKLRNLKVLIVETFSPHEGFVEFGECQFRNLTRLVLKGDIDIAFFNNFAYTFPYLEDLTLEMINSRRNQNIQISSRSIKFLRVTVSCDAKVEIAKFEVPNVSKFIFSCQEFPTVSVTAGTKLMESEINCFKVMYAIEIDFSNFLIKLRRLLEDLHMSKISLNIEISWYLSMENINTGIPPVVENLSVSYESNQLWSFPSNVCGLLWCCRPKFMSILCGCDKTAIKVLHEKLIKQVNRKCLNSVSTKYIRRLYALETSESSQNARTTYEGLKNVLEASDSGFRSLYDLEEVSVEVFEKSVMEWQPIKASLDASEILLCGDEQVRFKLIWGTVTPQHTIVNFVKDPKLE